MSFDLLWDPGWIGRQRVLNREGRIGESFGSFAEALATARSTVRSDNVIVVTWLGSSWTLWRFEENSLQRIDFDELALYEVPLGGSIENPRTFIVDSRGRIAHVARTESASYVIDELDEDPDPSPPDEYLPAVTPHPMENSGRGVQWSPEILLAPGRTPQALSNALSVLWSAEVPGVKAGGRQHSWSPVASTNSAYVLPEHIQGICRLSDEDSLFRVLAGTRIGTINDGLWRHQKALKYLGGWDGQTLGGVLATGTHGSTLLHGPLAEMARSIDLVKFDGRRVRIESEYAPVDASVDGWDLVRDDDDFNAALLSMGSMGIVHSYVLEVRERFWLNEVRTKTSYQEARATLEGENIYHLMQNHRPADDVPELDGRQFRGHPKPAFHLELLWNPLTGKLLVTSRHPVTGVTGRDIRELSRHEVFRASR